MENFPMGYEAGFPLRYRWGMVCPEKLSGDAFGITFWGDIDNPWERIYEKEARKAADADYSKTKKISIWFKSEVITEFSFELYPDLKEKLEASGWVVGICNKNDAVIIVAEKPDEKPEFSVEEIRELRRILVNFCRIIYGRELPEEKTGWKSTSADGEDMDVVWQKYFANEVFCNYNILSKEERSKGYILNLTVYASENGLNRMVQILLKQEDIKKLKGGLI